MGKPGLRRGALLAVGGILLASVALHYVLDTIGVFEPSLREPWDVVQRYACLCPIAGLVVGLGLVLDRPKVTTYGIVLWLMFPLGATIQQHFIKPILFEWALGYQLVLLAVVPIALAMGHFVRREVPLAIGVSFLGFAAKGFVNQINGPPEGQIWLMKMMGPPAFEQYFAHTNLIGLVLGVIITAAALAWRRRQSVSATPPEGTP